MCFIQQQTMSQEKMCFLLWVKTKISSVHQAEIQGFYENLEALRVNYQIIP